MTVHDFAAIGIGPFNLGLAALTEPLQDEIDGIFLEREPEFRWHPGMLLEDATVQTPFLADLVTLADPTSRLSFLNHAKQQGHLYGFYIRERFQPLRIEFEAYCRWAADELAPRLRFDTEVTSVEREGDVYVLHTTRETYRARRLVLGTGTPPHVPPCCDPLPGDAIHNSRYLDAREALTAKEHVVLVGGGQSAAEIFLDLLGEDGPRLTWVTRSPRFFPLEYSKLTLEMTSPEYLAYFHDLPEDVRDGLQSDQAQLYKGIDDDLIAEIFDTLYRRRRAGRGPRARLLTNCELAQASHDGDRTFTLGLRQREQHAGFQIDADGLVLATGYRYREPAFLRPIAGEIARDAQGRFAVGRNYAIDHDGERIFVQNAELHTHGFVAPDLGMAAYRNSCIIRELLGREVYPVEESIAFQRFGAPQEVVAHA